MLRNGVLGLLAIFDGKTKTAVVVACFFQLLGKTGYSP